MCLWACVNTLYGLNIGKQPYHLQHQALHITCPPFFSFFHKGFLMDVSDHFGPAAHTNPKGIEFHVFEERFLLTRIGTGEDSRH